jgi:hypothetical protein
MYEPTEQQIMERSYEIWERHGKPEGRQNEFWYLAEEEVRQQSNPLDVLHLTRTRSAPPVLASAGCARTIRTVHGTAAWVE